MLLTLCTFAVQKTRSVGANEINTNAFVVNTQVIVRDANHPPMLMETIFNGTKVYDTTTSDPLSIVAKFDLDARTVRLIDRTRRTYTGLSFDEIGQFQAGACAVAVQKDGLVAFMAQPRFKYVFDPAARLIRLVGPEMTYEAIGMRQQGAADVVGRLTEFADWSKQLSTVLYDGPPAQARIKLNKELKARNFQVARVTLRVGDDVTGYEVTSRHAYVYELSKKQEDFILDVEKQLNTFDKVSFSAFREARKAARVVAKK